MQTVIVVGTGEWPVNYELEKTFRMANGGASSLTRLLTQWKGDQKFTPPLRGMSFQRVAGVNSFHILPQYADTDDVAATCGNYSGYIGGWMNGNGNPKIRPVWWLNGGTENQVLNANDSGKFWDVNATNYFVGYFQSNGNKRAVRYQQSSGELRFPNDGSYNGSEARGINADLDMCGQAFGNNSFNPPVYWRLVSGQYVMTDLSTISGWPTGRSGYCVGMTDVVSSDANSPYIVGYLEESSQGANDGQPFLFRVGASLNRFRFLGTLYGAPTQMSNWAYSDANDPVVAFSGADTPMPFVWIGSPDPLATFNGAANDAWALLDPDAPPRSADPTLVTGMNSQFNLGGSNFPNAGLKDLFVTETSSWNFMSGTSHSEAITLGSLVSGASMADTRSLDGRYASVQNGNPVDVFDPVEMIVEFHRELGSYPSSELAFRLTSRHTIAGSLNLRIQFYNFNSQSWVTLRDVTTDKRHMETIFARTSQLTNYITGQNYVAKARVLIKPVSVASSNWTYDFEQGVFLTK